MIRFPERSHASRTPGASQLEVEPILAEPEPTSSKQRQMRDSVARHPRRDPQWDFSGLRSVLGP